MRALPVGQTGKYYLCVLRARDPGAVPRGQALAFYVAMLQDSQTVPQQAGHAPAALAVDDAPMAELASGAEKQSGQARGKRLAHPRPEPIGDALWPGLDEAQQPARKRGRGQLPPGPRGHAGRPPHTQEQAEQQAGAAASSGTQAATAAARGAREARRARPVVLQLEGMSVYFEEHGAEGDPDHYRRLCVRCPLGDTAHCQAGQAPRGKKRGMAHAQTRTHGRLEPYAFLGAWLQAASRLPDRAAHMAHTPTPGQVRSYTTAQGWLTAATASGQPEPGLDHSAPDG
jgi:hypothetical protein